MKQKACWAYAGLVLLSALGAPQISAQKNMFPVLRTGETTAEISARAGSGLEELVSRLAYIPHVGFPSDFDAPYLFVPPPMRPQYPIFTISAWVEKQARSARLAVRPAFPGKKQIDAVIFDMDGTLLDSLPAWEHSGTNFLRTQGIEPPDGLDEELIPLSLMDGARLLKERFNLPQSPEEILRLTLEPIRNHYLTDIEPKEGVPALLIRLKAQGIKIAVATASDRELTERAFKRLLLLPYIDFIITCDEVGVGKRSPKIYDEARARLGTDKARTLVVEDALYALQTAKRAGYPTAAIAERTYSPGVQRQIAQTANLYFNSFAF